MSTAIEFTAARTIPMVAARALAAFADSHMSCGDQVPCECCGVWCYPEYHHRRFRSRGGDWRPSNIVALSPSCHQRVTTCHDGTAREVGLSVSQWAQPEEVPVTLWYEHRAVLLDNLGSYTVLDND